MIWGGFDGDGRGGRWVVSLFDQCTFQAIMISARDHQLSYTSQSPNKLPFKAITQSSIETILINSRSLHNLLTLESSQYNSQFMSESHSLTLTHIVRSPLERGCEFCYKEFCAAFTRSDFIISNVERANGSARNFNYAWPGQIVGRIIRKKAQKAEWTAKTFSYARELEIASSTRRIAIEAGNMSEHFAAVNVCRLHTCHAAG